MNLKPDVLHGPGCRPKISFQSRHADIQTAERRSTLNAAASTALRRRDRSRGGRRRRWRGATGQLQVKGFGYPVPDAASGQPWPEGLLDFALARFEQRPPIPKQPLAIRRLSKGSFCRPHAIPLRFKNIQASILFLPLVLGKIMALAHTTTAGRTSAKSLPDNGISG